VKTSGGHTHVGGRSVGKGNPPPAELGFWNREPWMAQGVCALPDENGVYYDPDEWFENEEGAVIVCRTCPVRMECLQYKLENDISQGTWGGVVSGRSHRTYERKLRLLRKQREEMGG
jgi:hypothetical protein